MTYIDPDQRPPVPPVPPVYTETVETVVVRERSNTATWWIAALIALVAVIIIGWMVTSNGNEDVDDAALRAAELQAASDQARLQAELNGAQQSVDIARSDAIRASAEASRAAMEARSAEARSQQQAAPPTIIVTREPTPAPVVVNPVVTPPQQ